MKRMNEIWRNWSIRIKILVSFLLILLFVSLFNLYLNNNNYATIDQFNHTMMNYYTIHQLQDLVTRNGNALDSYLNTLDETKKQEYETSKVKIKEMLDPIYDNYSSLEIYFCIKSIVNTTDTYFDYFDQAIQEKEVKEEKYYEKYYDGINVQKYTNEYIQKLLYLSLSEGTQLYNQLFEEAEMMRQVSLWIILGVFVFALLIGVLFSNYLVEPIKNLAMLSMRMANGDLEVQSVEVESKDEIGILADSFNIMSGNIRKYVKDLEEKVIIEKKLHEEELELIHMEQLVKEAKYEALQSQINPHFLFNTLNSISRTALFEKANKTMKLTHALSDLFRYKLRQNKNMVSIFEELKIIDDYIYLQKVRFGDRIQYIEMVDNECRDLIIPVFLFQPIVENAIMHGIEPKIEGGIVRIKVKQFKNNKNIEMIRIRITDTGVGMNKNQLLQVEDYNTDRRKSIGVANVYQRYMLASNHKGRFKIRSRRDRGTVVEFSFEKGTFDV